MLTVLNCLVNDHDFRYVGAAVVICVLGCLVSTRLFMSGREAARAKRAGFVLMAGVAIGMTIWTTHFLAMLGFMPNLEHGFDPGGTLLSLGFAVATSVAGFALALQAGRGPAVEVGGAVLGMGIALMHFIGMGAFEIAGRISYDPTLAIAGILFGTGFGALALNRLNRPITRFCRYGGAAALTLGIASMHFTAMGAVAITPDPRIVVPTQALSDSVLAVLVISVTGLVVALAAITYLADRQTSEDALTHYRHLATHDVMTGLPNRAAAREELSRRMKVGGGSLALIAIDLNRFKEINDVFGHAAGDAVLVDTAERLKACVLDGGFVARIGGDEFMAIKSYAVASEVEEFVARISQAFSAPARVGDTTFSTSASIGIASYPRDSQKIDDLINQADLAMYRSKASRDGKWCWYDADADEDARRRGQIAIALRSAIAADELRLVYQPQIAVKEATLIGFEALLRWESGELGTVSPAEFIPVAEQSGLIVAIGDWVLDQACREAARWPVEMSIAVNVSPIQMLRPGFVERLREVLLSHGLNPKRLEIEITETTLIENPGQALHVLRQIKAMGVRIAMDDFGTGYSSLSTMFSFPFDKIKIDRAFLLELDRRPNAASVIETVIELGHKLSIPVLAEGVETPTQADFLAARNCDEAQGYLFGRPLEKGAAGDLARTGLPRRAAPGPERLIA
ncbi:MAG: bifunctional diguanylate cyclase/phosphodiesterase [Rhizobiaceae bacterium]|nr:bifunctional diguanylate cyclase/phosphodiesterase [Rhizobiaceae bacterium]